MSSVIPPVVVTDDDRPNTRTANDDDQRQNGSRTPPRPLRTHSEGPNAPETPQNRNRLEGAFIEIARASFFVSLPMVLIASLLMGLIFRYSVQRSPQYKTSLLASGDRYDNSAYYVNYSATRLATVSSWASSVTSFISTSTLILLSFPLARNYLAHSRARTVKELPSPYQLRLIIGLLGGDLGAFWSWCMYCSEKKRAKQVNLLWTTAASVLFVILLGFAILAADTWLHVTTSTVSYDVLTPSPQATTQLSRGLAFECLNMASDMVCANGELHGQAVYVRGATEAYRTLTNLSSINTVASYNIKNHSFAILLDSGRNSSFDFQATTFAISTQCKSISQACNLHISNYCSDLATCEMGEFSGTNLPYHCSSALYGDLYNSTGSSYDYSENGNSANVSSNIGFFMQMFSDENLTNPIGAQSPSTPNPFFFATGARMTCSDPLSRENEDAFSAAFNSTGFLLSCESTVYELTYKYVNGTVTDGRYSLSNSTMSNNVGWPLVFDRGYAQNSLENSFISSAQRANDSEQLADFYASGFSQTALSMMAGITSPRATFLEQKRQALLVARVLKAPFFTLITLTLFYAVLGIGLAVWAFSSDPRRTRDVQGRMSIAGLVAALFESQHIPQSPSGVEALFAEYDGVDEGRVALVDAGDGEWKFEIVDKLHESLEKPEAVEVIDDQESMTRSVSPVTENEEEPSEATEQSHGLHDERAERSIES